LRIVSFLSSATEIAWALGLEEELVGISHECDHPAAALGLPRVSRSRFDPAGMTGGEIDAAVRRTMEEHGSVYEVDADRLAGLRPDLLLTQGVCEVCAVPTGSVEAAVAALPGDPRVLSLDAHTLDGILHTIRQVADAAGVPERGTELVGCLEARMGAVAERIADRPRPRVLALEWLDPPFAPGHWLPEMVTFAGGENLLGEAGRHSGEVPWERVEGMDPERLLLLPCGWGLADARADADRHRARLYKVAERAVHGGHAWVGDGGFFSRSGPRVVDGIEALAGALHPETFPNAPLEGRLQPWR
jgi:iron complex transport system substrate-binding protein